MNFIKRFFIEGVDSSNQKRLLEALSPFGKKDHKEFYALKNINLRIRKGEILGNVGRNGSGKSTLLKIISGILTPTAGTVEVNGKKSRDKIMSFFDAQKTTLFLSHLNKTVKEICSSVILLDKGEIRMNSATSLSSVQ